MLATMPTKVMYLIIAHDDNILADPSKRRHKGLLTNTAGYLDSDLESSEVGRAMTEKTEGGEREEAGTARREAAPNPRTYSDFMRNLAAKYNTESSSE